MPEAPSVYTGTLQYEAENFDYKDIAACRGNAYYNGHRGYQGQGFVEFGTNKSAAIRDTVTVLRKGTYTMTVRYQAPTSGVTMQLLVNGRRYPLTFRKTGEVWTEVAEDVETGRRRECRYSEICDNGFSRVRADCYQNRSYRRSGI